MLWNNSISNYAQEWLATNYIIAKLNWGHSPNQYLCSHYSCSKPFMTFIVATYPYYTLLYIYGSSSTLNWHRHWVLPLYGMALITMHNIIILLYIQACIYSCSWLDVLSNGDTLVSCMHTHAPTIKSCSYTRHTHLTLLCSMMHSILY